MAFPSIFLSSAGISFYTVSRVNLFANFNKKCFRILRFYNFDVISALKSCSRTVDRIWLICLVFSKEKMNLRQNSTTAL